MEQDGVIRLRHILLGILIYAVLTVWVRERWALSGLEALIFLCAGGRLLRGALWGKPAAAMGVVPLLLVGVCLWGVAQLAARWTVVKGDTVDAVLYWLAAGWVAWLGHEACATAEDRKLFLRGVLMAGSAICLAGMVQLVTAGGRVFWLFDSGYSSEVIGPFVSRNNYACFVELLLPIALVMGFEGERHYRAYIMVAAALGASVVASASRAGTTIVLGEVALICLLRRRTGFGVRQWATLAVLGAAFSGVLGYQVLWDRVWNERDPYNVRRELLQASVAMVRAEPLHGFGLGTWPSAYKAFAVMDAGAVANHAHNEWAQWAAEGGLPVFAAMAAVFVLLLPAAVRSVWGIGVAAVFLHSLVDYPLARLGLGAWAFALMGVLEAYARSPRVAGAPARRRAMGWTQRLLAGTSAAALIFAAFLSVKLGWADTLYRRATAGNAERATRLAPDKAEYHLALAWLEPGRAPAELRRALALDPFLTKARMELAGRMEDEGELEQAEATLLEGARRDRQFAPAWALANFYARNRRAERFWPWARRAAEISYGDLHPLFDLCFALTDDAGVVEARAIPPVRAIEAQFLEYLVEHKRLADADVVARRLIGQPRVEDREALLGYVDEAISAGRPGEAREIWDGMSGAGMLPYEVGGGVVNGDFAHTVLNRGFDWRLAAVEGVRATQSGERGASLEVELSGKQPERCEVLSQLVRLQKGRRYRLEFEYRTAELPAETGVAWSLGLGREFALTGSEAWVGAQWGFQAAGEVERLACEYRRMPGTVRARGGFGLRRVRIAGEDGGSGKSYEVSSTRRR